MKSFLIYIIKAYKKFISPISTAVLGNACRFTPTCSQYTIEALEKYGAFKGTLLGIRRFLRCRPWGGMGFDPVPKK